MLALRRDFDEWGLVHGSRFIDEEILETINTLTAQQSLGVVANRADKSIRLNKVQSGGINRIALRDPLLTKSPTWWGWWVIKTLSNGRGSRESVKLFVLNFKLTCNGGWRNFLFSIESKLSFSLRNRCFEIKSHRKIVVLVKCLYICCILLFESYTDIKIWKQILMLGFFSFSEILYWFVLEEG